MAATPVGICNLFKNKEQQIPLEAYCRGAEFPHLELASKNTASFFSNGEVITKLQGWKGYWDVT